MIIKASELKVNALFINGNYKKGILAKSIEHVNCPINGNIVVVGLENGKSVYIKSDDNIYDITDTGNLKKSLGSYSGFPEYVPATKIYAFMEGSSSSGKQESLKIPMKPIL